MSDDNGSGSGSTIGSILGIIAVIIIGVFALKATFWAVKTALWLAVVGAIGYVGYTFVRGKLTSDADESAPKALPPGSPPSNADDDPLVDIDAALRELKALKQDREE
jgi:hypothetical protein